MEAFVRELELQDLAQLVELCREHAVYERAPLESAPGSDGAKEWRLAELFLSGSDAGEGLSRGWVVEADGRLVGFATVSLEVSTWHAARYLHLDCLFLREAWRGRGLGRRLLARAAAMALELGATSLQWQTPSWNEGAVRFYRRTGAHEAPKLRYTLSPEACEQVAQPPPEHDRR